MYDQSVSTPPLIAGAVAVVGGVGRRGSNGAAAAAAGGPASGVEGAAGGPGGAGGAGGAGASPHLDAASGAGDALRETLPATGGLDLFGLTVDPLLILSVGVLFVAVGVFFLLATRRATP